MSWSIELSIKKTSRSSVRDVFLFASNSREAWRYIRSREGLVRNGGEQRGLHQRLELLVVALEVKLHIRAVGIDGGGVKGGLFSRAGIEFFVEHARLHDRGKRSRGH